MISPSPLAQEKIWVDKAVYDLAEKRFYERLAKQQVCSSSSLNKERINEESKTSQKQCFIGFEKDGAGKFKSPEKVWVSKPMYDLAEKEYYEKIEKGVSQNGNTWNSLAGEVAKARQHIKNSLQCIDDIASITSSNVVIEVNNRINSLEKENSEMKQKVKELTDLLAKFEQRLASIEKGSPNAASSKPLTANVSSQSAKPQTTSASSQSSKPTTATVSSQSSKPATANVSSQSTKPVCDDDEDDGVDLFASDSEEEDNEAAKIKEQRLAEYAAKKSKKPAVIAKSSIVLDVKPWDDTTDMKVMEKEVRKITTDGLLWGASKLVPLAYGIHKLQISCVVEDDKVSVDWLQETIEAIEDYVQSVDIAAFNKI
ncbi:hypothetical protein O3M35_009306 [Rhynocoris fuscipes]|uniref:Elongation factor 1-delta n=1 Tax=Rhynocoris fuscipes TaxID=488301 RepID=A0AAW1D2G6_9HEMI